MKEVTVVPTPSLQIWHMIVCDYERKLEDDRSSLAYYEKALADGKMTEDEAKKSIETYKERICRTVRILNELFDAE